MSRQMRPLHTQLEQSGTQDIQSMIIFLIIQALLLVGLDLRSILFESQNTGESRYLEVDGTIFYKFKLPEVQINLHFG